MMNPRERKRSRRERGGKEQRGERGSGQRMKSVVKASPRHEHKKKVVLHIFVQQKKKCFLGNQLP
jgi:hypothetical protein